MYLGDIIAIMEPNFVEVLKLYLINFRMDVIKGCVLVSELLKNISWKRTFASATSINCNTVKTMYTPLYCNNYKSKKWHLAITRT